MNSNFSAADDDLILARFVADLEERGAVAITEYEKAYPQLAARLRDLVELQERVEDSRREEQPAMPAKLGEFTIVRRIPGGGMGEVYEAVQEGLGRRVAVKIIRRDRLSPLARARFLREQFVLARLHQTHIVPIHTAGEDGPLQYFAMQYIEGAALHHVVREAWNLKTGRPSTATPSLAELAGRLAPGAAGPPSACRHAADDDSGRYHGSPGQRKGSTLKLSLEYFRSVAQVMTDAAEAVHHAHVANILHRDIKPSNIIVDRAGQCWLLDFGLARLTSPALQPRRQEVDLTSDPVTVTGILGTPQYMAPEQFAGKGDVRADVWGLGVTLYELLTLRRAFDASSLAALQTKVQSEEPMTPRLLVADVPPDLAAVCRKALHKDPGQRYATAQAFAADLRRWLRLEPTSARPARTPRRVFLWAMRNKGWAVALALIVVSAIALTGWVVAHAGAERQLAERDAAAARRELLLQQIQHTRLVGRQAGWSDHAWKWVQEAAAVRTDSVLRDQAAAVLAGADAHLVRSLVGRQADSVVFDPTGKRVVFGGAVHFNGRQSAPGGVWTCSSDRVQESGLGGDGPVAWAPNDRPLQFVPASLVSFRLWDMAGRKMVREFRLPATGKTEALSAVNYPTLALSPEGKLAAAATTLPGGHAVVAVWEVASGKLLHRFDDKATALAFSPDSACLAAGDDAGRVIVWTLSNGQPVQYLRAGRAKIYCLAFGRNPRRHDRQPSRGRPALPWLLGAGDGGATTTVWDLRDGVRAASFHGNLHHIYALAFSPDGATVFSGGRKWLCHWDIATGRTLLQLSRADVIVGIDVSPDGRRLVTCTVDDFGVPSIALWQLEDGRGFQVFRGLANRIAKVLFSPDGKLMAALAENWEVAIWEVSTGRLLHLLEVPNGFWTDNSAMAFSPDEKRFAFAAGTEARLWDLTTGQKLTSWRLPPGLQDNLAFHPSGKLLLFRFETKGGILPPVSEVDRRLHPRVCRARDLFRRDYATPLFEIHDFNWHISLMACTTDGAAFVVNGIGGHGERQTIKGFDGLTGKELWSLPWTTRARGYHEMVAVGPRRERIVLTRSHVPVVLADLRSGRELAALPDAGERAYSPASGYWLGTRDDLPAHGNGLFRSADKGPLVSLAIDFGPSQKTSLQFDPAGSLCVCGRPDGSVMVGKIAEVRRRLGSVGLGW